MAADHPVEVLVFLVNGDISVQRTTDDNLYEFLQSVVGTDEWGTVVEPIQISHTKYTPKGDEKMPWKMPGFRPGDDPDDPDHDPELYGRRELSNWGDFTTAWVNENGVTLQLPQNPHFSHTRTKSGHTLLGSVVLVRNLAEGGCGDTVNLPVDKALLDQLGLKDIRVPASER